MFKRSIEKGKINSAKSNFENLLREYTQFVVETNYFKEQLSSDIFRLNITYLSMYGNLILR